ncbi:MAG: hypothetical protein K8S14_02755 [Actinomycetia bacterium]|nr:hypothetical protein [Actinomycetes bacterium]
MKKLEKKLKEAFYGVAVSNWPDDVNYKSYCRETNPPAYMIKMGMQFLYGGGLPTGGDKSEWEVCISYKENKWIISDWKRYAWRIYGPLGYPAKADELEKKLRAVAKILDNEITKISDIEFHNENISLHNQFSKIESLYGYFFEKAKKALDSKAESVSKSNSPVESLSGILNGQLNRSRDIEYNLLASIVFFFSLTELVFDSCFSLTDRKEMRFDDFRRLDWSECFKLFIAPSGSRSLENLYGKIIVMRTFYRNIPVHASPTFFFNFDGFGLIPSSYERLNDSHLSHKLLFDENEQKFLIDTIEKAMVLLKEHDNTRHGYLYAQSGLPIHIAKEAVEEIKKYMHPISVFEEELERRNELQDRIDNMDI